MQLLSPGKTPAITELKRAITATFGGLLYSLGVNLFIVPAGLYNGGLMGYCQLIRTLLTQHLHLTFEFDIAGILYFIVNIPILILAWIILDKRFVFRCLFNVAIVTLFLTLIPVRNILGEDILTNCLVGGVVAGAGTGISLWAATPGGGTDILGLIMVKKKDNFSVGKLNLIVDLVLYLLCLLLFDVRVAIYSVVYAVVSTFVIDKLHQQNINVQAIIVTASPADEMKNELIRVLDRGITELPAKGGYSGADKTAIMVVISKFEVNELIAAVSKIDKNAFVTFNENTKIFGNFEKRL